MTKKVSTYGTTQTQDNVASLLGHSTSNSGTFRSKMASLRAFGLIDGRGGKVVVTMLGRELSHPGIQSDVQRLRRDAFSSCSAFATLIDALPEGVDLDPELIGNTAVNTLGVAASQKDVFVRSFVESAETAGYMRKEASGQVQRLSPHYVAVNSEPAEDAERTAASELAGVVSNRVEDTNRLPVVYHRWFIDDSVMTFSVELDFPMPANAYGQIQKIIEAGDQLRSLLTETRRGETANISSGVPVESV